MNQPITLWTFVEVSVLSINHFTKIIFLIFQIIQSQLCKFFFIIISSFDFYYSFCPCKKYLHHWFQKWPYTIRAPFLTYVVFLYNEISIKHELKCLFSGWNIQEILQIVIKAYNFCCKFDAFITIWTIFELFHPLNKHFDTCFIEILL